MSGNVPCRFDCCILWTCYLDFYLPVWSLLVIQIYFPTQQAILIDELNWVKHCILKTRKMTKKISDTTRLSNEAGSCFLCRRLACEETREYFLNLFRDQSVDSELRIAAYLEVMRCPTYTIVKTIKHSLEVEEVNQG